jgi:hypothetical protein
MQGRKYTTPVLQGAGQMIWLVRTATSMMANVSFRQAVAIE